MIDFEILMTKEIAMTNFETTPRAVGENLSFVPRHSLGIRKSSFVISKRTDKKPKK